MGRVQDKVALVTGAARGQGRSHALRLAEEGAHVILLDVCEDIAAAPYPLGTREDLEETARAVERLERRAVRVVADVRDAEQVEAAVAAGLEELGRLDIVCANAGIVAYGAMWEIEEADWDEILDVNLTGVWHTLKAVTPPMIAQAEGGSIIITSSSGGRKGIPNSAHYVSTKHAVVGLMRGCANELGRYSIRVNTVHPTGVDTDLIQNEATYRLFNPHLENPTKEDARKLFLKQNTLPIPWVEPVDISNAVLWLASDEARYVTGAEIPVDAGFHEKV